MSYVAIWLQACLHWRCAYFQTLSWNDTIFVVDWDILYKLCGSANKWGKGFIFSGKIWWQLFSCNEACSKYHTLSMTTPKYTLPQRLVWNWMKLVSCSIVAVSDYVRLFFYKCSISESSIVFSWQNSWVSSIKFYYRSQSKSIQWLEFGYRTFN